MSPSVCLPPQLVPEHHYFPPEKSLEKEEEKSVGEKNTLRRYKSSVTGKERENLSSPHQKFGQGSSPAAADLLSRNYEAPPNAGFLEQFQGPCGT